MINTKSELRNNIVSLVIHDLKKSMNLSHSICSQLQAQDSDSQHKVALQKALHENQEAHRYIDILSKLTQIEAEDTYRYKEPIDLNEIIESIINRMAPVSNEKGIVIQEELEPMFLIEGNHLLIKEVLFNVLENAIKYSTDGGHIIIKSQQEGKQVKVEVKDQGVGINQLEQKRVFEKFYRSSLHCKHIEGSGLGLYLAKYFVEMFKGEIFLESKEGHGTCVQVCIPTI